MVYVPYACIRQAAILFAPSAAHARPSTPSPNNSLQSELHPFGSLMISDPYPFMCLIATALGILFGLTRHRFFKAVRLLTYTLLVNSLVWLVAAAKGPLFASAAHAIGAVIAWLFFLMVNIEFAALPFLLCRGTRALLSRRQDHLTNRCS